MAFGGRPFRTSEFASRTASPRAAKTLSELKSRGLAERVGRGRYRLLAPNERPDRRAVEWSRARNLLLGSGLPMAWSGSTAVEHWTRDRYYVSPSVYVRLWHIDVPKESLGSWLGFLREHRLSANPRRRLGNKVILHPVDRLRRTIVRGEPVIPRDRVLRMIRMHRAIYADADRLVERGPGSA